MASDVKPVQFGKTVPTGIEPFSTVMFRYGSSGDAGVVVYRRTPATSEPVYVTPDAADDRGRRRQLVRDVPHQRAGVVVGDRHVAGDVGIVRVLRRQRERGERRAAGRDRDQPGRDQRGEDPGEAVHGASFTVERNPRSICAMCADVPGARVTGDPRLEAQRAPFAGRR